MVLVTGGTGFLGQAVVRRLTDSGYEVRLLLKPGKPQIPHGIPVEAAISGLLDKRGVRAAMVGIDQVVHLAGAERGGLEPALRAVDVEGTRVLSQAARQSGIQRLLYVSHLGAEPASAYPALRAKARAEQHIVNSEVPYTILRSSLVYGEGDRFTTALAMLLAVSPLIFLVPGDGSTSLQPLWVEDLATCMLWAMEEPAMQNRSIEIGGPEFLTISEIIELIMRATGSRRWIVGTSPPVLRGLTWALHRVLPRPPVTTFWLDYLATSRTAGLDALPRQFGLKPALMSERVDYLKDHNWAWEFLGRQFTRGNGR